MPTTQSQSSKKRKHVPSAPTTAETTKRKTPRGTNDGRPPRSSGPTNSKSAISSSRARSGVTHCNGNRKGLSRDHCGQIRERLQKNLDNPPKSQPMSMRLHTENQPTRKLANFDQYQLSEISNFGLPMDQSIDYKGMPVLPDNLEDWSTHLQKVARDYLQSDNDLLFLDTRILVERLELETNQKVYVSYEQLKSIKFEEIILEARRAREDATKNIIYSLAQATTTLVQTTDATNKQVEKTS